MMRKSLVERIMKYEDQINLAWLRIGQAAIKNKGLQCHNWERYRNPTTGRYENRQLGLLRNWKNDMELQLMFGSSRNTSNENQGILNQIMSNDNTK